MDLKVVILPYESAHYTIVLDQSVAKKLDLRPNDRVRVVSRSHEVIATVTIAKEFPSDSIGIYLNVSRILQVNEGEIVQVEPTEPPRSLNVIRKKLARGKITFEEAKQLMQDIVGGVLSEVEIAALVTAIHFQGMSIDEAYNLTVAMVETGRRLSLNRPTILDKHSLGGVPGDKTSLLVVPIIASLGFTIPKTSSRAITSPAGTADRMEAIAPVNLSIEEMTRVIEKTNGCIVWGGALNLAPADDIIIRVEYPLGIDPFFVPSILAKKLAVGSTHVVLDVPTGRGTKARTLEEARRISYDFIELGSMLGIKIQAVSTYAEEPVGYAVGPALEAREALQALSSLKPLDLVDKAVSLAGTLLEMVGIQNGYEIAFEALRTGKAEKKFRQIIEAQGGNPEVKPEDIPLGDKTLTIYSEEDGFVYFIDNPTIALVGKMAGAPIDKGAGVLLHVKIGDRVKPGDPLFTVYSYSSAKLQAVERLLETSKAVGIGKIAGRKMLLEKVSFTPSRPLLER
ncbi:AMP phosphorylase [Infirmifilum sp. NZ]|uniref:AMP phosphorylase n=1 Tax=Infirmifilum sp. NZ TaxID=2926850 RepID=UPI0027A23F66|nr:AMP phosphorylase [Infirmifilum sp. NZ]UNQ74063.1 AMP phosphorylase [Infirmifilum sp. NZ]